MLPVLSSCRRRRTQRATSPRYSPGYVVQRDGLQHRHFISGGDISTMRHGALSSGDDRASLCRAAGRQ